MAVLSGVPGDAIDKANAINAPICGFRSADRSVFYASGSYAGLWSSSPEGEGVFAQCAAFRRGDADALMYWADTGRGMSLRFLSDKNQ